MCAKRSIRRFGGHFSSSSIDALSKLAAMAGSRAQIAFDAAMKAAAADKEADLMELRRSLEEEKAQELALLRRHWEEEKEEELS